MFPQFHPARPESRMFPFRRPIVSALLALAVSGNSVLADDLCISPASEPTVPAKVIGDLVGWIAMHTMYDTSGLYRHTPRISFCHVGEVIAYEGTDILVEKELRAAYSLPDRVIHLVEPWSAGDPYDRSVLLHEFIHVVQLEARDWPCVGAPELEAYMLQAEYLREFGVEPDFDWRSIFLLSICPEN